MGFWRCSAPNCGTTYSKDKKILRGFPTEPKLRKQWLERLPAGFEVKKNTAICEDHFKLETFEPIRQDGSRKLKFNAVPTVFDLGPMQPHFDPAPLHISSNVQHSLHSPATKFNAAAGSSRWSMDPAQLCLPVLGDITNTVQQSPNSSATKHHAAALSVSLDENWAPVSSTPKRPRASVSWGHKSNEDVSFLTECHSAFSVKKESSQVSLEFPSIAHLFREPQSLNACDQASHPLPPDEDSSKGKLCDITGTFVTEEEPPEEVTTKTQSHDSPTEIVDKLSHGEALKVIDEQRARIVALEADQLRKNQELEARVQQDARLAENLNISTTDNMIIPLSTVTKENVISLIKKQAEDIHRIRAIAQEAVSRVHSLEGMRRKSETVMKKYLAVKKVTCRLQAKLARQNWSPHLDSHQQIIAQRAGGAKGLKWTPNLIRKGLIRKMECGTSGYAAFVADLPFLPSVRCLQEHIQFIKFKSGLLDQMFDLLEAFAAHCSEYERDCQLVLDEMAIEPGEHLDRSTNLKVGRSTFPTHVGMATKALVVMLAGVCKRWKISVALYFTNERDEPFKVPKGHHNDENKTGIAFLEIIKSVVVRAESINLKVCGVTSDMGADNLAFWKAAGIIGEKNSVVNSIPNPACPERPLFVMPDVVHVFKAIKNGLEGNKVITLSDDVVKEEGLHTNEVNYNHIQDLYEFEQETELKVAFRLKPDVIKVTNHYLKMRTGTALAVLNHRSAVGLERLAFEKKYPGYLTTAWFFLLLNTFFDLMTGRCKKMSLCPSNKVMYGKSIKLIKKIDWIFSNMNVGKGSQWKPFQRGIRVLCASILGLEQYFFHDRGYYYLLLGRFTQDCIENLFSLVRLRQPVPHALAFLHCLKVITIAQYSMAVKSANYNFEESEELRGAFDFFQEARKRALETAEAKVFKSFAELCRHMMPQFSYEEIADIISEWEKNVIYDMAGSVIRSIQKRNWVTCKICMSATRLKENENHPNSIIVDSKEYTLLRGGDEGSTLKRLQIYVTDEVFKAIVIAEVSFRKMRYQTLNFEYAHVVKYFVDGCMYLWNASKIPACHNMGQKILLVFFEMRVKEFLRKEREKLAEEKKRKAAVNKASKTAGMHDAANKTYPNKK